MRNLPFQSHPSEAIIKNIEQIGQQSRFVIDIRGPTKFIVKPIGGKERFQVSIGLKQDCSCNSDDICIHILYVMMKYFGVPDNCDLLWQKSLTEHEIERIIDGRVKIKAPTRQQVPYKTKSGKSKVKRLAITSEDVCPICYDNILECDKSKISWCRSGCGGNFHRKCIKEWIASRRNYGEEASCPICRAQLDILGINPPKKRKSQEKPPNISNDQINDMMYRDLTPDDYHLLLKLDENIDQQKNIRPNSFKNNNQRIKAANSILSRQKHIPQTPDLSINTTNNYVVEKNCNIHQINKIKPLHPPKIRKTTRFNFNDEIIGTKLFDQKEDFHEVGEPSNVKKKKIVLPSKLKQFKKDKFIFDQSIFVISNYF